MFGKTTAVVTKDPSSIIDRESALTNQAKAARKPTLRSETRDKPINTYPALHPRARDYYMAQDAAAAAGACETTNQAKAEKAKAVKDETN